MNKVYEQLAKEYQNAQRDSGKAHLNEIRALKNIERFFERNKICNMIIKDEYVYELTEYYWRTLISANLQNPTSAKSNQSWAMKELMLSIIQDILTEEEYLARIDIGN